MKQKKYFYLFLIILLYVNNTYSKELVQFSGYIKDVESFAPVPYAAIYIKDKNRGTISGSDGYFNFVIAKGDTIIVKSLGFKTYTVVVPIDIEGTTYSKEINLEQDAVMLKGVTIRPLPEPHQLRYAMLNLDIPDNLAELAQQTIANSIINDDFERSTNYDGAENYNAYAKQQATYYYNRFGNQRPGISLTDPFAWAGFIKKIKENKKAKKK
jgi:hypothetical protein